MSAVGPRLVVAGGSAGAIEALGVILPALPAGFAAPVVVVVHLPGDRPSLLCELFAPRCALPVEEAQHGTPLGPGVYFAPPDYHLAVEPGGTLSLALEPPVRFSRPSIDVLFESAAWAEGRGVLGILLSGANEDGARGLRTIREAGGLTWVQAPATALVATMPEAGVRHAAPAAVLTPDEMAERLARLAPPPGPGKAP